MGEVYRARDTRLERDVAIKVLAAPLAADPQFRERFEREARSLSAISHPHICAIYDVGRQGDIEFIVMEFVEGEPLSRRLERGPLPPAEALRVAAQIADALEQAHRAGIVHRDLKPANVILDPTGLLRIMDFGIARAARARGPDEDGLAGTPEYLAPEQLAGEVGDVRSDLYACGTMLYEMLAGRRPFTALTFEELAYRVTNEDPPDLQAVAPATPPDLARAVMRCLVRDPAGRWASADDVIEALAKVEG